MAAHWSEDVLGATTHSIMTRSRPRRSKAGQIAPVLTSGLIVEFAGVLFDPSPWRRWLFQLVVKMGLQAHYQTFNRLWDADYEDDVNCGRRDYWTALRLYLVTAGLTHQQVDEVEAAGRFKYLQLEYDARPLPGVLPTLSQLAQRGCKLVLLANVAANRVELHERLRRLQLADKFQAVVCREDLQGAALKDRRERVRLAAAAVGQSATTMTFVSCKAAQLRAAASAGARTIAFNHDSDAQADIYLDQFDQLVQVIQPARPTLTAA